MKKIVYKFPVVKQIHTLHLLINEMERVTAEQENEIQIIRAVNAEQADEIRKIRAATAEQENEIQIIRAVNAEQADKIRKIGIMNERQENEIRELKKINDVYKKKISNLEEGKISRIKFQNVLAKQKYEIQKDMQYDFFRGLPEEKYEEALCDWYYKRMGKRLDLAHPKTFNEKIQWLKLYDSTPLKTRLTDKLAVREWIQEKIGEEYLIPCLGVWDSFEKIDFDALPDQFVLKTNHSSGWNVIVRDKKNFDKEDARKKISAWLGKNYAWHGLELHYKNIEPKVYAEKYIENMDHDLYDYRFLCFHGEVKYVWVDVKSGSNEHQRTIYNAKWEEQNVRIGYPRISGDIKKPASFEKMKKLAGRLCRGFIFVRVDLYDINGKIYFGEMTFTSGNGEHKFEPEEWDDILGAMIMLPELK